MSSVQPQIASTAYNGAIPITNDTSALTWFMTDRNHFKQIFMLHTKLVYKLPSAIASILLQCRQLCYLLWTRGEPELNFDVALVPSELASQISTKIDDFAASKG